MLTREYLVAQLESFNEQAAGAQAELDKGKLAVQQATAILQGAKIAARVVEHFLAEFDKPSAEASEPVIVAPEADEELAAAE